MKKLLVSFTLGAMLVAPVVWTPAWADGPHGNVPAAVDQLLAQDMIQLAQTTLKVAGFDPGRTDGVFDAQTSAALRRYQAANGIPVSGLLDSPTRRVLLTGSDEAGEG